MFSELASEKDGRTCPQRTIDIACLDPNRVEFFCV